MAMGIKSQFTVVTPSYQMTDWLLKCSASIADQNISVQHIIQDAGTPKIKNVEDKLQSLHQLHPFYSPELVVEPDDGMYQAINRGFCRAKHDICGYLNCDEQYFPGALRKVDAFFSDNPEIDVVFGDVVVFSEKSEVICYRKAIQPRASVIRASHLPTFTCATFFRHHVIEAHPFREDLKAIADAYWMLELKKYGIRMATLGFATSSFTYTGQNLSDSNAAQIETSNLRRTVSPWIVPFIKIGHRVEKAFHGCYRPQSGEYAVFLEDSHRTNITLHRASGILSRPTQ